MKTRILLSVIAFGLIVSAFSQKAYIELTFTAEINGQHAPLDSIFIENLTQGGDTTLYAPDTVLVLEYSPVGINNNQAIEGNSFSVSQNYPNPFNGKTEVNLYLPAKEDITISVQDILGRELVQYENTLKQGNHSFAFYSGNEKYYLLTVSGMQTSKTIKMINANSSTTTGNICKIVYNNYENNVNGIKSQSAINSFVYDLEDELKYFAWSEFGEMLIIDTPSEDKTYTFQFVEWPTCPGMPFVTDLDSNIYNTVQIGNQCWMKENLKTTTFRNGTPIENVESPDHWENTFTGAYVWYENDISWKDLYGAMYNWYAVDDDNGICPTGWHVPSNSEWQVMTSFIGGLSKGKELKSCRQINSVMGGDCDTEEHPRWESSEYHFGTDDYWFSGLPGGFRYFYGSFTNIGHGSYWWTSTNNTSESAHSRAMYSVMSVIQEGQSLKQSGFSVRCIKD